MANDRDTKVQEQIDIANRMQLKWLQHMESMLDTHTITATDMAILYRFFKDNGWTVDETRLPKGLRDKLTRNVEVDDRGQVRLVK
jgi:hypothetical protein